jgi:hypothetical protein
MAKAKDTKPKTKAERLAAAQQYRDSQKRKKLCYNGSCQNKTDGDGYCAPCNKKIDVRRKRWADKHAKELAANGNGHASKPRAPRAPRDTPPADRPDVTAASQESAPQGDTGAA